MSSIHIKFEINSNNRYCGTTSASDGVMYVELFYASGSTANPNSASTNCGSFFIPNSGKTVVLSAQTNVYHAFYAHGKLTQLKDVFFTGRTSSTIPAATDLRTITLNPVSTISTIKKNLVKYANFTLNQIDGFRDYVSESSGISSLVMDDSSSYGATKYLPYDKARFLYNKGQIRYYKNNALTVDSSYILCPCPMENFIFSAISNNNSTVFLKEYCGCQPYTGTSLPGCRFYINTGNYTIATHGAIDMLLLFKNGTKNETCWARYQLRPNTTGATSQVLYSSMFKTMSAATIELWARERSSTINVSTDGSKAQVWGCWKKNYTLSNQNLTGVTTATTKYVYLYSSYTSLSLSNKKTFYVTIGQGPLSNLYRILYYDTIFYINIKNYDELLAGGHIIHTSSRKSYIEVSQDSTPTANISAFLFESFFNSSGVTVEWEFGTDVAINNILATGSTTVTNVSSIYLSVTDTNFTLPGLIEMEVEFDTVPAPNSVSFVIEETNENIPYTVTYGKHFHVGMNGKNLGLTLKYTANGQTFRETIENTTIFTIL